MKNNNEFYDNRFFELIKNAVIEYLSSREGKEFLHKMTEEIKFKDIDKDILVKIGRE